MTFTSENIFVEKKDIGDIPNTDLPDECIYFSLQNQKIISYISKLETELIFGNTVSLPDTEQNKGRKFSAMHELTISNHYNWGLGKNEEQFSIYKSDFDQLGLSA